MSAGSANYRNGIRGTIRALWGGVWSYDQFYDGLSTAIDMGITTAWYEGAAECGIVPADLTPEEKAAMRQAIFHETNYITRLAADIEAGSKANGGKLAPLMARAETWINRYRDVVTRAQMMACEDQKLRWVLHGAHFTKDPCNSCVKLNGKVKRASYWQRVGVQPQNPPNLSLECGGWLCGCAFEVTDEPVSKGPLPHLP